MKSKWLLKFPRGRRYNVSATVTIRRNLAYALASALQNDINEFRNASAGHYDMEERATLKEAELDSVKRLVSSWERWNH
jgi:hypothetical protein